MLGHIGVWNIKGIADLIGIWPAKDGKVKIRIFEVKSSWKEQTAHRIQVAIYVLLLSKSLGSLSSKVEFEGCVINKESDLEKFEAASLPPFRLEPLIEDVQSNAVASAFRDPRFPPYAFTEHGALMLAIKQAFPDATYTVRHAVGIDASDLFVARTGIRGSNDLVWVGRAANVAAKMCGLRHGGNFVYITKEVLDKLNDSVKYSSGTPKQWMWESFPWDGQTIYRSSWVWSAD